MVIDHWLVFKIAKYSHEALWLAFKIPKYCHKTLWLIFKIPKYYHKRNWKKIWKALKYVKSMKTNITKGPYKLFIAYLLAI